MVLVVVVLLLVAGCSDDRREEPVPADRDSYRAYCAPDTDGGTEGTLRCVVDVWVLNCYLDGGGPPSCDPALANPVCPGGAPAGCGPR